MQKLVRLADGADTEVVSVGRDDVAGGPVDLAELSALAAKRQITLALPQGK